MGDPAVRITNPKVATLEPTWRRFRGLSVLFDNPGTPVECGVRPLAAMTVEDAGRQCLYDEAAGVVADVDPDGMRDRYGFCPLPRHTYHVTVCDGPSEWDLGEIPPSYSATVAAVIDGLPDSLGRVPTALEFLHLERLPAVIAANPLTLGMSGIAIWGHVLVARLGPVGPTAPVALERVARARADLAEVMQARLRLSIRTWRPHLSLGYFANPGVAGDAAEATLARWNRALAARPRPTITFSSAAVYGFTDMASYFRLGV